MKEENIKSADNKHVYFVSPDVWKSKKKRSIVVELIVQPEMLLAGDVKNDKLRIPFHTLLFSYSPHSYK